MVRKQFDALTLSFIAKNEMSLSEAVNEVLDLLKLGDLWEQFVCVGRDRFYPYVYRYNDISICVCADDRVHKQGICIRFSGNGLAFYQNFLAEKGEKLRRICRAWRAASVNGVFTRCTRIDYAVDDIHFDDEVPLLTMRKIHNCVKNREFRSRFICCRPLGKQCIDVSDDSSAKGDSSKGSTIYFGVNHSQISCRFYDKLLEQKSKKCAVEDNVTSWVRCEFEFHDSKAASVFNDFCDMDDDDYSGHMSEVINNYVSFIKKDDINRSRCSVKRWWASFMGTAKRTRLTIPAYKPATFAGNSDWFKNISPSLYKYIQIVGLRYFLDLIVKYGKDRLSQKHQQLENDFIQQLLHQTADVTSNEDFKKSCDSLGLDYWVATSRKSKYQAMKDIQEDYKRFRTVNGLNWKQFDNVTSGEQFKLSGAYGHVERDEYDEDYAWYGL